MDSIDELLQHHGVKGMKWGVRRFQRYPKGKGHKGRFLDKPKKSSRVVELETLKKSKKVEMKKTKDSKNKAIKRLDYQHSKKDVSDQKIRERIASKDKSELHLSLEKKYMDKGMSNDEASIAAYRNIRTRKILATAAAVAATSAVAITAREMYKDRVDTIIKANTPLQRLTINENEGIKDAFYASFKKSDNIRYKAQFGRDVRGGTNDIKNVKKMIPLKDIKQASPKTARDTFFELYKNDKEFRDNVITRMDISPAALGNDPVSKMYRKAKSSISDGKVDKNMYEVFNRNLVLDDDISKKVSRKFYSELTKKGYGAVKDVNDTKRSIGFGAKNPVIVFNSKDKINLESIRKLTEKEIGTAQTLTIASNEAKAWAAQGAIFTGAYSGVGIVTNKVHSGRVSKFVDEYRDKNPGSKLSYGELSKMYERQNVEKIYSR